MSSLSKEPAQEPGAALEKVGQYRTVKNRTVKNKYGQSLQDRWSKLGQRWGVEPLPLIKGLGLWLGWMGLTWLAFILSLTVVEVGERGDISVLDGLLGGCFVGIAQWLIIRPYLQKAYRWIGVSGLCWGGLALLHIGAVGWIAPNTQGLMLRVLFGLFYGFYVGLVLGVGQWWVMRKSIVRAGRWALLSAGIWSVSLAFGWLIGGGLRLLTHLFVSEVFGLVLAWGMIAALSGLAIVGMVSSPYKAPIIQASGKQPLEKHQSAKHQSAND